MSTKCTRTIVHGDTKDSVISARPAGWQDNSSPAAALIDAAAAVIEELDRDTVLLELADGQTLSGFEQAAFADSRTMQLDLVDSIVADASSLLQPLLNSGKLVQNAEGKFSRS